MMDLATGATPAESAASARDPALPQIDTLIDPPRMRTLFARQLQRDAPQAALRVESAELEKVNYRVGRYCGALYRLWIRAGDEPAIDHWFYVRHGSSIDERARFEAALRVAPPSVGWWPAVAHWAEWAMVVWAFPCDPGLPQLPEVVDPERVRATIRAEASRLGLNGAIPNGDLRCERVKHMPAKRTVLRFELELEHETVPRTLQFFSKTYRDARSRDVYRAIEAIRSGLVRVRAALEIPQPLIHFDELHTYWQEAWPGRSMSELHETPELDRALPGIARVLAELHALRGIDLRAATYVEEVAASTTRDAARIGSLQPALAGRAKGIAQRLVRLERRIPAATRFPQVPIHGAFRLSQLLAQGERIALVDFDGVALGDPHYDVAELQASLVYRVFRGNLDRPAALRRGGAFLDAYEATGPCSPDERRLAWLRAAFVLEKLYLSLKNLELAILPQSEAILDFVESELDALEAA